MLNELEEPEKVVRQIAAICTVNTIVHINAPNAKSVHRVLAMECGLIHEITEINERNKLLQQHFVFTIESLMKMIEGAGFFALDRGSYFIKPFTHVQMMKLLENHIIGEDILDGFYGLTKYMPDLGSEIYVNCKVMK